MITSEICRNEKVASLPDAGRFLFIGIFSNADDDGRLKASPKFLKATIFPYDEDKTADHVTQLRDQCAALGLIRLYSKNGTEYLDLPGWREHQLIRKDRYRPSKLPSFDEADEVWQPSGNQMATSGLRSIGEGRLVKSSLVKSNKPPYIPPLKGESNNQPEQAKELFDLWNSLGVIKHKKLTGDMTRAIKAASRDFSAAEISQAMKNYAHIVNDKQCFFKYRWTLKDFLKRGLEKFLDLEVALSNYRRGGVESEQQPRQERVKPITYIKGSGEELGRKD
ncbi:MAG: hypothetical protein Q7J06_07490 [Bacteroidales bacterium]|nr:hypothetical protein [Bacteroidales bacterium]